MKKILTITLKLFALVALVACGGNGDTSETPTDSLAEQNENNSTNVVDGESPTTNLPTQEISVGDTPNGIDSMETVEIGGALQSLYFRGDDVNNPAILFLHGGPGWPQMATLHDFQYELEPYFTIVHWDQRNSSKTFFLNDPEEILETLTFERVLADAYEVTQHVRERLNAEQIIILGYSWGSILGSALVQAYPQYFSAYIGLGQVVENLRENYQLSFEALLEAALASGDSMHIAAVEALGPPPSGGYDDNWTGSLLTLMQQHGFSVDMQRLNMLLMSSPYYTHAEKMYFFEVPVLHYQMPLMQYVYDEEFDIRNFAVIYTIPVFYIMGEFDRQTSYQLAAEFFEEITAPYKAFFTIPNSAHAPQHENTAEFNRVLIEEIRPLILAR